VEPIAELMDEHFELLEIAGDIGRDLATGDHAAAERGLLELEQRLDRHVDREERGVFAALRAQGEFVDAIDGLEAEHVAFDSELEDLAPGSTDFERRVRRLMHDLSHHIDKENLGIFPVAVTSLGADGWDIVSRAHATRLDAAGSL
jgi:hemerythrin-like domain-containing protein